MQFVSTLKRRRSPTGQRKSVTTPRLTPKLGERSANRCQQLHRLHQRSFEQQTQCRQLQHRRMSNLHLSPVLLGRRSPMPEPKRQQQRLVHLKLPELPQVSKGTVLGWFWEQASTLPKWVKQSARKCGSFRVSDCKQGILNCRVICIQNFSECFPFFRMTWCKLPQTKP